MGDNIFWGNIFKIKRHTESLFNFLKNNQVFRGFTSRDLRQIEKIVHVRKFKKDEIVFKEDEPGTGMYIIKSGKIRITKHKSTGTVSSGEEIITHLKENDFFGELTLVEKTRFPRTASAYADSASELIGFFKPDLLEIIERNPKLGVKIIMRIAEIIGARLRTTTSLISSKKYEIEKLKTQLPQAENEPQSL